MDTLCVAFRRGSRDAPSPIVPVRCSRWMGLTSTPSPYGPVKTINLARLFSGTALRLFKGAAQLDRRSPCRPLPPPVGHRSAARNLLIGDQISGAAQTDTLGGLLAYPCFCFSSFRAMIAHSSQSPESLFPHICEVGEPRFFPGFESGVGCPMKLAEQKHGYARSPPGDIGSRHSVDVERQSKDSSQRSGARLGVTGGGEETAGRRVQPPCTSRF